MEEESPLSSPMQACDAPRAIDWPIRRSFSRRFRPESVKNLFPTTKSNQPKSRTSTHQPHGRQNDNLPVIFAELQKSVQGFEGHGANLFTQPLLAGNLHHADQSLGAHLFKQIQEIALATFRFDFIFAKHCIAEFRDSVLPLE